MSSVAHGPPATRRAQTRLGIALILPLMAMVVVFFLFPLVNAIYYAFVDFNGINLAPPFIGLGNFVELATDPAVLPALWHNVIWIVIGTASPLVIGFALALLMWKVRRGSLVYRVAFFLPYILPQVAVGVVWTWIYDPTRGWLNQVLELVGLGGSPPAGSVTPTPRCTRSSAPPSGRPPASSS